MSMRCGIAALMFTLNFTACTSLFEPLCKSGEQVAIQDILYFGMAMPNGFVTATDWAGFLDTTVTPRFPQGLTVAPAAGQWRGENGVMVREPTQMLQLVHAGDSTAEESIATIIAAYKLQFQQEAVLRVKSRVCASF